MFLILKTLDLLMCTTVMAVLSKFSINFSFKFFVLKSPLGLIPFVEKVRKAIEGRSPGSVSFIKSNKYCSS